MLHCRPATIRGVNGTAERLRQLAAAHSGGSLPIDDFLQEVCVVAAERLRCTRATRRFEADGERRWLRCLAMHDDQPAASIVGSELKESDYRDYFAALMDSGIFESADAVADSRLALLRDSYLAPLKVRSVLDVAFNVNGSTFGVLCCEQVGQARQWRTQDVAEIRRIGSAISLAPGTKRVSRVEENTAADGIELSAGQIQRLNDLTPATGERHDETNMAAVDR